MQIEGQILFRYEFIRPEDYYDFNLIIESGLKKHKFLFEKKIVICTTELIQNNIIHNNSGPSAIEIFRHKDIIDVQFFQTVSGDQFNKIVYLIDTINNMDLLEINKTIKNNIMNSPKDLSCGNGLMICRAKSGNRLGYKLVNKVYSDKEILFNFKIQLKFENYDKDN